MRKSFEVHRTATNRKWLLPAIFAILLCPAPRLFAAEGATANVSDVIQFLPQIYAIRGQDLTLEAKTAPDVEQAVLHLRRLSELGDYSEFPMTRKTPGVFTVLLELTQYEDFNWERIEYYIEARKGGRSIARTDSFIMSFVEQRQVSPPIVELSPPISEKEFNQLLAGVPIYKKWWFWVGTSVAVGAAVMASQGGGGGGGYTPPTLTNFKTFIDGGSATYPPGGENGTQFNIFLHQEAWIKFQAEVLEGKPPFQFTWTITNFNYIGSDWELTTLTQSGETSERVLTTDRVNYIIHKFDQTNLPLTIKLQVTDSKNKSAELTNSIRFFAVR